MKVIGIPIQQLVEAPWNPNQLDPAMLERLRESLERFGLVSNLVVRPLGQDSYEVLSGNQRLGVLRDLGYRTIPCVAVELDDPRARLLAQALNRIQGQDDLGLKAELVREVLAALPQAEVLALLPETSDSLTALSQLGEEDLAASLREWQEAQEARLKHLTIQLTANQLEVVEEALKRALPYASSLETSNPNSRGNALFVLCKSYLEREVSHD